MNSIGTFFAGYIVGWIIAAIIYRLFVRPGLARWAKSKDRQLRLEISQLARSEFMYWGSVADAKEPAIIIGAQGAAANILAAANGYLAPWHRQFAKSTEVAR